MKKDGKLHHGKVAVMCLCDGPYSYRLALRVVLKATSGHRASGLTPELPEVVWLVRRSVCARHRLSVSRRSGI